MRSHESLLNMSSQFVSKLLITSWRFVGFFLNVQVKICSIFLRFCFSCLLLMVLCATTSKPYLKSMWIISTLPTWPITLSKWKIDYLIFISSSRQIHIGCPWHFIILMDAYMSTHIFFQDLCGYWTSAWFVHNASGQSFPSLKDRVLWPSVIFWDVTYPPQALEDNH